jgi:alpha-tubulin suppressor-like RCC1 family protein
LPRELYAWGRNYNGQVGDGTTVNRSSPVQVAGENWAQVSAGNFSFTTAVTTDGKLFSWGRNTFYGQLGQNDQVYRSSPTQVGLLTNWSQVSAGGEHTASIKTDGTLWAWGRNVGGRLGDGTVINRSSPVQIGGLTNWAQVSAGDNTTAAVTTAGELYTWGYNTFSGQLGHNDTINRSSPTQVGVLTNWFRVSVQSNSTVALKTDNTLWGWGRNNYGQVGDNTTINRSSPVQVGALSNWKTITTGGAGNAAFAITEQGELYAWGRNNTGQLGDGTTANRSSPVQIGALTNWAQVSVGAHTASFKTDGTLWGWGRNNYGQVGDNTTIDRSSPVQIGALTNWAQVAASAAQTAAILKG